MRIADSRRHLTLQTRAWEDPAAWGLMLVDLARHVANAYEQLEGRARAEVLTRIRQCFDAERESPTDQPTGTVG